MKKSAQAEITRLDDRDPVHGYNRSALLSRSAWRTLLSVFLTLVVSCDEHLPIAEETPQGAFVLNQVQIDDKHPDGTRWHGVAKSARGNLNESDFETIEVTITSGDTGRSFVVNAPQGTMNFETRQGVFHDLVVTDEDGGVLRAGLGRYNGEAGTLTTEGPMIFEAQGLSMTAPQGVMDLQSGELDVVGPITGRYDAPEAPKRRGGADGIRTRE